MSLGRTLTVGGLIYGLVAYAKKWWPFDDGSRALTAADKPLPLVAQHINQAINDAINRLRTAGVAYRKIEPGMDEKRAAAIIVTVDRMSENRAKQVLPGRLGNVAVIFTVV